MTYRFEIRINNKLKYTFFDWMDYFNTLMDLKRDRPNDKITHKRVSI